MPVSVTARPVRHIRGSSPAPRSRRRRLARRFAAVGLPTLLILQSLLTVTPVARASHALTQDVTIPAGAAGTAGLTVHVPAQPPKADILIAIDTTGSMGSSITQAKAYAQDIVNKVQNGVPASGPNPAIPGVADSRFAVVEFRDFGDTPVYAVRQGMTPTASLVQTAVNAMSANGGGDSPEAHNTVFRNSYTPAVSGDIGWRSGTKKIVVVISDAEPHGAGKTGQDLTGCNDQTTDPVDNTLSTKAVLEGMAAADRTLFMVRASTGSATLECYQSIAAKTPGGAAVNSGSNLGDQIVSLIHSSFNANVIDLHMAVATAPAGAAASWFGFTPGTQGAVTPSDKTFTANITVPTGTPAGTYAFDLVALADGTDIGHQQVRVIVPSSTIPVGMPTLTGVYKVGGDTYVAGHLSATASTAYTISFGSATACAGGTIDAAAPTFGSTSVTTNADGQVFFNLKLTGSTPPSGHKFVAAKVTGPGGFRSDYSPCVVEGPDNDTWPRALPIGGSSTTQGFLDLPGRERWFKFAVQPGARVQVDLKNLPADYDLVLFRDVKQAYDELTNPTSTQQLTKLGAEYAASGFTASGFTASGFTASGFTASGFTASGFTASGFTGDPFSGAQTRTLVAISASDGTGDEVVAANTWLNTGNYYVRVSGKNGASSLQQPFTLTTSTTGNVCNGVGPSGLATLPASGTTFKSIILLDSSRLPGYTSDLRTQIDTFAGRSDVDGAVVDLKDDARITALNAQADGKPACVYAKNLVAESIRDLVLRYRTANSTLANVVLIGGDDVIPFFRSPDQASLAPESGFVPPVSSNSASEASLRNNYVLSQDAYGAGTQISLYSSTFPIPELAVGRLVETASEISGMLTAYTATNGVVTPGSSLVTGYDFLDDAATLAQSLLTGGTGAVDGSPAGDKLITPFDKAPSDPASWTAAQLKTKMLGTRHDVVFLAGHFSANSALAADYATSMTTADLVGSALDQSNVLVLSIGCHSGYNVLDGAAVVGVTDPLDWAQALARKKMTGVLGTGYQYGDTEFLEYSERIYTEIARRLRYGTGPVSIGQALVAAKLDYLKETPDIRDLHEKALRQTTLYGLPMMRYDMPQGRELSDPSAGTIGATTGFGSVPGSALGLQSAELTVNPSLTEQPKTLINLDGGTLTAKYLQGGAGVVSNPGEPAIPLESVGVGKAGFVLRGVGFLGGNYVDQQVVPLSGAPATELKTAHTPFTNPTFFPSKMWTPNYIDALTPGGNGTKLLVTPAQHKATNPGSETVTRRKFSDLKLKLFYSQSTAPGAGSDAPSISDVGAAVSGGNVTFTARVVGDPRAGVQEVWVTYTGLDAQWHSIPLTQNATDSSLWTKTVALTATSATKIDFMVQAVNGFGLVGVSDVGGAYHQAFIGTTAPRTATSLGLASTPTTGVYGGTASVTATLLPAASGKQVVFSIGSVVRSATTDSAGKATAQVPLTVSPGVQQLTANFAGDATTLPSGDAREFTISKASTTLTLSVVPAPASGMVPEVLLGADSGITATLSEGAGAVPLAYRTVFFVLSGPTARTTSVITDFAGRARLGTLPAAVGVYTVTACFNGPENPSACSALSVADPTYGSSGATTTVKHIWPWTGFLSPVDNLGILNDAKAGSTIPVKFSLGGDRGLGILAVGSPKIVPQTCPNSSTPVSSIEEISLDAAGLTFSDGRYQWNWKTPKTYAGKCYRLDVILIDGTTHSASFRFK